MVQAAEQPVEQVALSGDVLVADLAAAVVVGAGLGRGGEGGEGPLSAIT
jgi:hypothetical protein